jgi:hypothetical protein
MSSFRQQPLTWLFLIANVAVDLAWFAGRAERDWGEVPVLAQILIAGGWLAVGKMHRLARAGAFVTVVNVLAALASTARGSWQLEVNVWRYLLGTFTILGLVSAVAALSSRAIFEWLRPTKSNSVMQKLQFPLAEIFGWTIIVAVGTLSLKEAWFSLFADPLFARVAWTIAAAAAGMMLGVNPFLRSALVSLFLTVVCFAIPIIVGQKMDREYQLVLYVLGVVATGTFVMKLDEQTTTVTQRRFKVVSDTTSTED